MRRGHVKLLCGCDFYCHRTGDAGQMNAVNGWPNCIATAKDNIKLKDHTAMVSLRVRMSLQEDELLNPNELKL